MSLLYVFLIEPAGGVPLKVLEMALQQAFRLETRIAKSTIDVSTVYDPSRNQYHGSALLLKLVEGPPSDAKRILGITDVDLFIPIFEYLFGEAQTEGIGAVISTYRLKNELYGLPPDEAIFADRLIKEAIHELGHTFGLIHCFNPLCVMNPSTFVEQIDAKSKEFCRQCRATIDGGMEGA